MLGDPSHDGLFLGGVRVLVVDDCEYVCSAVISMLEHYGAAATAVATAAEALEAVERERPDVLVSDLQMPGRGGCWLIRQVRALPPERGGATPAAALTWVIGPEQRASILRAGFQYHLEKPVAPRQLAGVVAILALKWSPLLRNE